MPDVVGMHPPVDFHLREDAVLVNALDLRDRRLDLRLLRSVHIRIFALVETGQISVDRLYCFFGGLVVSRKNRHCLLLDERQ